MRSQGPPTAYPSGLQPIANDPSSNRQVHRRVSRTDLDFEEALRAEGTVMLREGLDVNSLGVESPSPMHRSFTSASTSSNRNTPTTTPVNRAISRVALQPPTPVIVPPNAFATRAIERGC
ncbi:hypothetical protein NLJ89_g12026 [Agrocybe chaxingu]|uniref:Uncharacterized protein n=1 Tax=Agrocybe chaxingu TaxID=84603 RepID=A0A9W8MPG7_9AGAR|nr:hypothetical protein NLJ89_g12026 [Agrocybe chaxingu]